MQPKLAEKLLVESHDCWHMQHPGKGREGYLCLLLLCSTNCYSLVKNVLCSHALQQGMVCSIQPHFMQFYLNLCKVCMLDMWVFHTLQPQDIWDGLENIHHFRARWLVALRRYIFIRDLHDPEHHTNTLCNSFVACALRGGIQPSTYMQAEYGMSMYCLETRLLTSKMALYPCTQCISLKQIVGLHRICTLLTVHTQSLNISSSTCCRNMFSKMHTGRHTSITVGLKRKVNLFLQYMTSHLYSPSPSAFLMSDSSIFEPPTVSMSARSLERSDPSCTWNSSVVGLVCSGSLAESKQIRSTPSMIRVSAKPFVWVAAYVNGPIACKEQNCLIQCTGLKVPESDYWALHLWVTGICFIFYLHRIQQVVWSHSTVSSTFSFVSFICRFTNYPRIPGWPQRWTWPQGHSTFTPSLNTCCSCFKKFGK